MTQLREQFAPMRLLYLCVVYLLAPIVGIAMLLRGFRDHSYWHNFGERFGLGAVPDGGPCLWVHAVSVGEIQASAALVRALRERYPDEPLVVTTVTPTGAQRARELFAGIAHVRYVPYDLPGSVRRFFDRVRPRVAIILETELWPNLYHECGRRGVPLVLASARISPRSIGRYRRLAALFREALANGIVIAAQSPADADRFRFIGANPLRTHVMGNIKFDFALPEATQARGAALRAEHAAGRPVWVAGSTHPKEEDLLLDAHRLVRSRHPDALLILVPVGAGTLPSVIFGSVNVVHGVGGAGSDTSTNSLNPVTATSQRFAAVSQQSGHVFGGASRKPHWVVIATPSRYTRRSSSGVRRPSTRPSSGVVSCHFIRTSTGTAKVVPAGPMRATLARVLGVPTPNSLDGSPLSMVIVFGCESAPGGITTSTEPSGVITVPPAPSTICAA